MKSLLSVTSVLAFTLSAFAQNQPPAGFTALFNGKDLTGWRGGDTADPRALMQMPAEQREKQLKDWTTDMLQHWKVENGELLNDGNGKYATTEKDYGNFELLVEYNMAPKGDSGIYLRNVPQVQIWDHTSPDPDGKLGCAKGSGGLWNNSPGAQGKDPLVLADKPAGEWNQFRITIVGSRVSVWLNDKQVVKHAILENYYDRANPIPARGPVCLQTHGAPIRWRNIFIREIGPEESTKILTENSAKSYESIWNGKDFEGWAGDIDSYEIKDGAIVCKPGKGGNLFTKEEYSDFGVRLEFKTPTGGNNGLAIRFPGTGDPAYDGMCEIQVLDENYAKVKGPLDPRQYHGGAYGMAAAAQGYQHPTGEWNFQEVWVKQSRIRVELNGTPILMTDLSKITEYLDGKKHPGKDRTSGHFGFAGHNDPVEFRNISINKPK
jgi:hypothetical protein